MKRKILISITSRMLDISGVLPAIIVILFLLGAGLFFWQGVYLPKSPGSLEEIIFSVKKGEGSKEISVNLENQELIKSGPLFRLYVLHRGVAANLQAGEYLLSPSMTVPEIVKKLVSGKVIKEKITIIEGWNLRDISLYFKERGLASEEEFFAMTGYPMVDYSTAEDLLLPKDFSQEFGFLQQKPKNLGLEGYLFPDTYEINKGETLEDVIKKIMENFDKKLTPGLTEDIQKQGKTIFEVIILASLIEKEVKSFEDRQIVSGILQKRIAVKMPLQVDATITYITGKKTTQISAEETKIDSPYNTYKYKDLPPGPISNPGLESIRAALYPKESEYWYYLSKPDGETVFSKTLEEHNKAKENYLK